MLGLDAAGKTSRSQTIHSQTETETPIKSSLPPPACPTWSAWSAWFGLSSEGVLLSGLPKWCGLVFGGRCLCARGDVLGTRPTRAVANARVCVGSYPVQAQTRPERYYYSYSRIQRRNRNLQKRKVSTKPSQPNLASPPHLASPLARTRCNCLDPR